MPILPARLTIAGAAALALLACEVAAEPGYDAGPDPDAAATPDAGPSPDAGVSCGCTTGPHGDRIYVLSDEAELYTYDPVANEFAFLAVLDCPGGTMPYSMAVDTVGRAWVLFNDSHDIYTVDLASPSGCADPDYVHDNAAFDLFGMSFTASPGGGCPRLYAHSYSGSGPFSEGPGVGSLGVIEYTGGSIAVLSSIDYDGGELAGTGDGRLYAFAGVSPAKLVEYDPATGATIETTPLQGFSKTNASAFAFYAGDLYFFTEAPPVECDGCLTSACPQEYADCQGSPGCADEMACAIAQGYLDDLCGGSLTPTMQECLQVTCGAECLPPGYLKVSQVTHFDLDGSGGGGQVLTVVYPQAPIRVVGAGTSPCVPYIPL